MASDHKEASFSHEQELRVKQQEIKKVEEIATQHEKQEQELKEQQKNAEGEPPADDQEKSELDQLKRLAEEHKKKAEENYELYLRARADLENTRRRFRNEKAQALKYAYVPLLESLLPVLDNFERALKAVDESGNETIKEGIEMVHRHFLQVLNEAGLSVIEAEGKPFDPNFHNAVMQVEVEGKESGIVVEELQRGYCYLDRVIRPTMVKVSK